MRPALLWSPPGCSSATCPGLPAQGGGRGGANFPGGRADGGPAGSPQLDSCSLALLPAPITTASYSRCSRAAAPAWAKRAPDGRRDRRQPCSQREEQSRLSLPRSPAATAPQRLAMAALRPAAWTLLSRRNFSQGFRAQGGDGGARAGNALRRRGGWSGQGHPLSAALPGLSPARR